jgi:predicted CXXCH cytochrome family protein
MSRRFVIALFAFLLTAEEPAILRPSDGAILKPGELTVIARQGGLLLDGKPLKTTERAPGVWTAPINPPPGEHELKSSAGQAIRFRVDAQAATYRAHPPAAACETCHAVKNGVWELRVAALESACASCHDLKKFPETHSHNTTTLADCQTCHNPHGSAARFHLLMPKEVACKQCHG